ncbi:60S ribosomal protein L13-1, partial [Ananas comosus]
AAGIPKKLAPTIGNAVDHRRKNHSLEGLQANVQMLKMHKTKLAVVFAPQELAAATQVQGRYMPILREKPSAEVVKTYAKLHVEKMNQRQAQLKKAAEAEKVDK